MKRRQSTSDQRLQVVLALGLALIAASLPEPAGLPVSTPSLPPEQAGTTQVWLQGPELADGLYLLPVDIPAASLYDQLGLLPPPDEAGAFLSRAGHRAFLLEGNRLPVPMALPSSLRLSFFQPLPLNLATSETLMTVPGIGRRLADRIVALRQEKGGRLESLDELLQVPGIGRAKLRDLKSYLELGS